MVFMPIEEKAEECYIIKNIITHLNKSGLKHQ